MDFVTNLLIIFNSTHLILTLVIAIVLFIYFGFKYHRFSKFWKIGDIVWSSVAGLALISGLLALKADIQHSKIAEYERQLSFQVLYLDNYITGNTLHLPCLENGSWDGKGCIPRNYKDEVEFKRELLCKLDHKALVGAIINPVQSIVSKEKKATSFLLTQQQSFSPIKISPGELEEDIKKHTTEYNNIITKIKELTEREFIGNCLLKERKEKIDNSVIDDKSNLINAWFLALSIIFLPIKIGQTTAAVREKRNVRVYNLESQRVLLENSYSLVTFSQKKQENSKSKIANLHVEVNAKTQFRTKNTFFTLINRKQKHD
jgi:hypothetical protein